ncbi:Acyl-CoA dehydrogenase C-terminal domain-containing protein, partial [Prevotella nigrescens]
SIYEGTTQLQVVAAVRYITNGTYLNIMKEMLENDVCDGMKDLKARVERLVALYEEALEKVKASECQDTIDFLARRLYNMTAGIIESLLLIEDASKAPELFEKSANVFVRMTEEEVAGSVAYIKAFDSKELEYFKAEDTI